MRRGTGTAAAFVGALTLAAALAAAAVFIRSADSGEPRRVVAPRATAAAATATAVSATVTPIIAYERCELPPAEGGYGVLDSPPSWGVHVIDGSGANDRYLGSGAGPFSWSPDGGLLAYTAALDLFASGRDERPTPGQLIMNAAQHVRVIRISDGADVIPPRPGSWPHFSPNGRWLAYQAAPAKDIEPAVCLASIENPDQVFVVANGYRLAGFDLHSPPQRPVWSPDGRYLVVVDSERRPYVVEARSDAVPVLIWDRPTENLNWSPNGRVIAANGPAFQETPDVPSVWTLDPSGEGWGRPGGTGRRPLWTPDAHSIITSLDSESRIQSTEVATTMRRTLADGSFPALSPDGRRVAYVSNGGVNGQAVNLFLLDLTTDEARQLTQFDSTFFMETPTWSPDGALIAFSVGGRDMENGLYVVNPDVVGSIRLLYSAIDSHVWSPTWSADGTQIVFDLGGGHD